MKTISIQFCSRAGDKKYNLEKTSGLINSKSADLIVLPEFFNTGVSHDAFINLAEEENSSETLEFMSKIAQKNSSNIVCGSIIEREGDKLYNTSYVLDRKGEIKGKYRKIHLFNSFGGNEGECITPGDKITVLDLDFGRLGMSICFDMRYPMHFRELAKAGAQVFSAPTAWAFLNTDSEFVQKETFELWRSYNRTRASENLAFIVSANQCGAINPYIYALGNSMITDPFGRALAIADDKDGIIEAEFDLKITDSLRKDCPIL